MQNVVCCLDQQPHDESINILAELNLWFASIVISTVISRYTGCINNQLLRSNVQDTNVRTNMYVNSFGTEWFLYDTQIQTCLFILKGKADHLLKCVRTFGADFKKRNYVKALELYRKLPKLLHLMIYRIYSLHFSDKKLIRETNLQMHHRINTSILLWASLVMSSMFVYRTHSLITYFNGIPELNMELPRWFMWINLWSSRYVWFRPV